MENKNLSKLAKKVLSENEVFVDSKSVAEALLDFLNAKQPNRYGIIPNGQNKWKVFVDFSASDQDFLDEGTEFGDNFWLLKADDEVSFGTEASAKEFYQELQNRGIEGYMVCHDPSSFGNFLVQRNYSVKIS